MNKTNYSYIGIAFVILVFGIIFVPKIVDRATNKDITREESRSVNVSNDEDIKKQSDLAFLEINGTPKKVPAFSFVNHNGKTITNEDYKEKVYVVELFIPTSTTN